MLRAERHLVIIRSHLLLHGFVRKGNHFHRDVTYEMLLQIDLDPYTCRRSVRSRNVQMSQKQRGWGSSNFQESSCFCRTTWLPDLHAPADLLSCRREQSAASEIIQLPLIGKIISFPGSHWEQKPVLLYSGILPCGGKVFRKQAQLGLKGLLAGRA